MNARFFAGLAVANFAVGISLMTISRALFVQISTYHMDLVYPLYVVAVTHVAVFVWLALKSWPLDDYRSRHNFIHIYVTVISILVMIPIWLIMVPSLVDLTWHAWLLAMMSPVIDMLVIAILLDLGMIAGSAAAIRFAVEAWPRGCGLARLMKKLEL